jgi:hypothetical protein
MSWEVPTDRTAGVYWVRHRLEKVLRIQEFEPAHKDKAGNEIPGRWHGGPATLTSEEMEQWGIEVWSERIPEPEDA